MLENLAIFTAVIAAVQLSGKAGAQTQLGATLMLERLAYWPCYLAGIIYLRTAIWLVSFVGLAMVAAAVLPGHPGEAQPIQQPCRGPDRGWAS